MRGQVELILGDNCLCHFVLHLMQRCNVSATFQWLGKLFVVIERFNNLQSRFTNTGAIFLSTRILMPSYPEALLLEIFSIMSMISFGVIRGMLNTVSTFNRKETKFVCLVLSNSTSASLPDQFVQECL